MFLIVGGDSEIGAAAARAMQARSWCTASTTRRRDCVATDRPFLDLSSSLDCWKPPNGTTAVCVCAAIARMAACASDPNGTAYINVQQTSTLVDELLRRGIYVLFLSTNQVFDGGDARVLPDTPYSAVSEYGRQKVRTESALRERISQGAPAAILRLAKVISPEMPLIRGWISDLSAGRPVSAFRDMTLAPTPIDLVSAAIAALLHDRLSGIFQLTGPRDVTYAELADFIAVRLGTARSLIKETTARSAGLPQGATPRHTTLDSTRLRDRYGFATPDIWEVVDSIITPASQNAVNASAT